MKRNKKNLKDIKIKVTMVAFLLVCIIYALFAQPLADNIAIKLANKVSEIVTGEPIIPTDDKNISFNNKSDGDSSSGKNNNFDTSTQPSDKWNISFTDVVKTEVKGSARELSPIRYDSVFAEFNVLLNGPQDSITYEFTITNKGVLDAKLANVDIVSNDDPSDIEYRISGINVGDELDAGKSTKALVTVFYNDETAGNKDVQSKSATFVINYIQK